MSLELARGLKTRGHEVTLLHETRGNLIGQYEAFVTATVARSLPPESLRRPWRVWMTARELADVARRHGCDVLFTSHLGFLHVAAVARRFLGLLSCFHLGLPRRSSSRLDRWAFSEIGAGVAPSLPTLRTWEAAGWPAETLHVVRNWTDSEVFRPRPDRSALRRDLGLPESASCVIYLGRLCPEKGILTLLEAWPKVKAAVPRAQLVLVGDAAPEFERALRAWVESHQDVAVSITRRGAVDNPQDFLAAANVTCVPSNWEEPFGLTLLEAMSCGTPVVATSVGVLPEILGAENADLIVPPDEPEALAQRLTLWLQAGNGGSIRGSQLRRRALDQYSPESSVEAYECLLRQVAERAPEVSRRGRN